MIAMAAERGTETSSGMIWKSESEVECGERARIGKGKGYAVGCPTLVALQPSPLPLSRRSPSFSRRSPPFLGARPTFRGLKLLLEPSNL